MKEALIPCLFGNCCTKYKTWLEGAGWSCGLWGKGWRKMGWLNVPGKWWCPLWLPPGRGWQCWGKTSRSVEKIAFRRVSIHGKEDCPNCVNLLDVFSTFPSKVSLQFQLEVQENWSVVYLARGYGKILPTCQSFPEATITILTPNICSATFFFFECQFCALDTCQSAVSWSFGHLYASVTRWTGVCVSVPACTTLKLKCVCWEQASCRVLWWWFIHNRGPILHGLSFASFTKRYVGMMSSGVAQDFSEM